MTDSLNTGPDSLRKRDTGVTVLPGHRSEASSHETWNTVRKATIHNDSLFLGLSCFPTLHDKILELLLLFVGLLWTFPHPTCMFRNYLGAPFLHIHMLCTLVTYRS